MTKALGSGSGRVFIQGSVASCRRARGLPDHDRRFAPNRAAIGNTLDDRCELAELKVYRADP
jgi:hypothetical protein